MEMEQIGTERGLERESDSQSDRQTDRHTHTHTHKCTHTHRGVTSATDFMQHRSRLLTHSWEKKMSN